MKQQEVNKILIDNLKKLSQNQQKLFKFIEQNSNPNFDINFPTVPQYQKTEFQQVCQDVQNSLESLQSLL